MTSTGKTLVDMWRVKDQDEPKLVPRQLEASSEPRSQEECMRQKLKAEVQRLVTVMGSRVVRDKC